MNKKGIYKPIFVSIIILLILIILLFDVVGAKEIIEDNGIGLPNPTAVYCVEQGYKYEIRTNPDGSQYGVCISHKFKCNAWAFYRGECSLKPKPRMKPRLLPFMHSGKFCGIMIRNKLISYSKNSDCFCPLGLEKITIWIKPYCPPGKLCALYFYPAYTCTMFNGGYELLHNITIK